MSTTAQAATTPRSVQPHNDAHNDAQFTFRQPVADRLPVPTPTRAAAFNAAVTALIVAPDATVGPSS